MIARFQRGGSRSLGTAWYHHGQNVKVSVTANRAAMAGTIEPCVIDSNGEASCK